ncbi:MAG: hypothetical protein M1819_004342 [Sarea resinae]|nr:MAG: hypothetical protein M1819_004342 [Sarea resinae]
MSTAAGAHIYVGPWINWSHGLIKGSTITLSSRDAGLLTAFLALFVSFAGGQLWTILSFVIHQSRASLKDKDGLHHQQQAILRNTGSAGAASYQLARLALPWWKRAKRPVWRTIPVMILPLINLVGFGVAGIFSSQVTKAPGNETLIHSDNCGWWAIDANAPPLDRVYALQNKVLNDSINAANYARSCYGLMANPLDCSQYTKAQIAYTTKTNVSCPFAADICLGSTTMAFEMDTGRINSHEDLGINSRKEHRIEYRHVTTCALLKDSKYFALENQTSPDAAYPDDQFQRLYLGPIVDVANWTYQYNVHAPVDGFGYELGTVQALAGVAGNTWLPVDDLNRTDADVSLFFLTPNAIGFAEPVDDPFFAAHQPRWAVTNGVNQTWYDTDYYIHLMGCSDQHQYCNPTTGACTALTSSQLAVNELPSLGLNYEQHFTGTRIGLILGSINTYFAVNGRGAAALRARDSVYESTQGPLPDNQWTVEASSWFAVGLAKLQRATVDYATGPATTQTGSYVQAPLDPVSTAQCRAQKVRQSTSHVSFSVLGVAIILVVGSLIILVSLALEPLVGAVERHLRLPRGRKPHRFLSWVLDDKLQLQRLAYEEAGMGVWHGATDAVPVTAHGDRFGLPDGVDPRHPRLRTGLDESLVGRGVGMGVGMSERESASSSSPVPPAADGAFFRHHGRATSEFDGIAAAGVGSGGGACRGTAETKGLLGGGGGGGGDDDEEVKAGGGAFVDVREMR